MSYLDFQSLKLESLGSLVSKEHLWCKLLAATGTLAGCYGIYKFFANRKFVPDVHKKCVLITGCDSGFGRALALRLDNKGCPVFAGCLTESGAAKLKNDASPQLQTLILDVSSTESIKRAYEFVKSHLPEGTIFWGVVNNAGIGGAGGPIEFVERSEYEQVMQVNFFGQTDVISTFMPLLKKSCGRIVNVASASVYSPGPGMSAYVASKCAVLGYTEALRREKKMWGIGVSTIIPGLFKTSIVDAVHFAPKKKEQWDNLPEEIKEEYGQEFYDATIQLIPEFIEKRANRDISSVAKGMECALFSVNPKARYFIGADASLVYYLEYLPFGFMDRLFSAVPERMMPKALKNKE